MKRLISRLFLASLSGMLSASCVSDSPSIPSGERPTEEGEESPDEGGGASDPYDEALAARTIDYQSALRLASLRLRGVLPTLQEVMDLERSSDPAGDYRQVVAAFLEDPRFAARQIDFWRNELKVGGTPLLDSAGTFAAQLVVEGRPYTELLTATAGTCPTYSPEEGFVAVDCDNGTPTHAGLLTHPGVLAHFTSNMAFRRTRWVQEVFACTTFPAEGTDRPIELSETAIYATPWPFESIASPASGGDIDFLDHESVVCANCHATMNHVAPLLATFDANGQYSPGIAVTKPTEGAPLAQRLDWLPEGEGTGWRFGMPADSVTELGAVMASDPDIAECAVARAWNWAMGKDDIVDTLSLVPAEVVSSQMAAFEASNHNFKDLLFEVFTSDDFIRF